MRTYIELEFNNPNKSYSATVTLEDGQPVSLTGYVWKIKADWCQTFEADILERTGIKVRVKDFIGNNGHPQVTFETIKET